MNTCFIGGSGRSGTTISRRILGQHPLVATLPFEYRFIIDPDGIVDFYCSYTSSWSPYMADRRLRRLEKLLRDVSKTDYFHKAVQRILAIIDKSNLMISRKRYVNVNLSEFVPNMDAYISDLMNELCDFCYDGTWMGAESYRLKPEMYFSSTKSREDLSKIFGRFLRKVIYDIMKSQNKNFYVEDNPWNILFASELLDLIPEAKIIHVYRDPRDVIASYSKQIWMPTDKIKCAKIYESVMNRWFSIRSILPAESYFEFKLENLVRTPRDILVKVCDFIELPWDESLLDIDLSESHSGRWKREYSSEEEKQINTLLKDI
ncbi:TPA: sulfotransferase, partial [Candidatus Bathyarchaeota archaeon]|nr:sulfotransferase [Candidatus Bathyarchaeota archaeon]